VLDIVGNTTVLDSIAMLRRGGTVCEVGFLGGGGPLTMEPVFQIPSGRHFTTFASAVVTGNTEFPMSEIPFQDIIDGVAAGTYKRSRFGCLSSMKSKKHTGSWNPGSRPERWL
jgi:NADPH:quinone reductase